MSKPFLTRTRLIRDARRANLPIDDSVPGEIRLGTDECFVRLSRDTMIDEAGNSLEIEAAFEHLSIDTVQLD